MIEHLIFKHKMKAPLLLILLLTLVLAQQNLFPTSKCLHNCALCSNNELTSCSGQEFVQCVKGYNGTNCELKPQYAKQMILMDQNVDKVDAHLWENDQITKCWYRNSKMDLVHVYVMGLYRRENYNQIQVQVRPNYHNFIVSFNLIRGSWTPYSDLLRVSIIDQDDNTLSEHYIELLRRQEINPKKQLFRCNNEPLLVQKYQIEGILNPQVQQKLILKWEGMMFSDSIWGLTNVRIAFGCSKFLIYNGAQCQDCSEGYFSVKDVNDNVIKCNPCPLNCVKCDSANECSSCEEGFSFSDGKCQNNHVNKIYPAPMKSLHCEEKSFQISSPVKNQQKILIQLTQLPLHKKFRILFHLAYQSLALENGHYIQVVVNGVKQKGFTNQLINGQNAPKETCKGFGSQQYYELFKFVSQYFNHKDSVLKIELTGDKGLAFGIEEVRFQYEEEILPKKDEPKVLPKQETYISSPKIQQTIKKTQQPKQQVQKTSKQQLQSSKSEEKPRESSKSPIFPDNQPLQQEKKSKQEENIQKSPSKNANIKHSVPTKQRKEEKIIKQPFEEPKQPQQLQKTQQNKKPQQLQSGQNSEKQQPQPQEQSKELTEPQQRQQRPKDLPDAFNSEKVHIKPQFSDDSQANQLPHYSVPPSSSSQIEESIDLLKKNKWNIRIGVRTGKDLILCLFYPIQIEHFPYFIAVLENKNITIVPQVIDKNKQEQELHLNLHFSLLTETIDIYMEQKPPNIKGRLLQAQQNRHLSSVYIKRYDHITDEYWGMIESFATFFSTIAWITIISAIVLSFLGQSVLVQHFSLLLQVLFLHTYIFSEYLPINFKYILGGLERMENLDYFHSNVSAHIQKQLLGDVIQYSPPKFLTFNKDINFTRAVYPCIIINVAYAVWFLLLKVVKHKLEPLHQSEALEKGDRKTKLKLYVIRLAERNNNFWQQVWQYQFIVFFWAACAQFYNTSYPLDSNRSHIPNIIFCVVCFGLITFLPTLTMMYLHRVYPKLDYFEYSYWYENIFYMQLPEDNLPNSQHRVNILVRNLRFSFLVIFFAFVGDFPIQSLVFTILIHAVYLVYIQIARIQIRVLNRLFSIIQYLLLILLASGMLVAYGFSTKLQTTSYMVMGIVLIALCLLLVLNGLARVGYGIFCKFSNGSLGKKQRSSVSQEDKEDK